MKIISVVLSVNGMVVSVHWKIFLAFQLGFMWGQNKNDANKLEEKTAVY